MKVRWRKKMRLGNGGPRGQAGTGSKRVGTGTVFLDHPHWHPRHRAEVMHATGLLEALDGLLLRGAEGAGRGGGSPGGAVGGPVVPRLALDHLAPRPSGGRAVAREGHGA